MQAKRIIFFVVVTAAAASSALAQLPAPSAVSITNPTALSFTVQISPVFGATSYSVSFHAHHDATDSGTLYSEIPSFIIIGKSNKMYHVYVAAVNGNHISSSVHTTARTAPNGVEVLSFITTPTFITIFLEQIPGVTAYQVEVTNTNNPTDTRVVAVPDAFVQSHYVSIVTNLLPNTNYSARARASQIAGVDYTSTQSPFGPVKTVITDMISAFGSVVLSSTAGSCPDVQSQLLSAYQSQQGNVVDVVMLPTLTSGFCQHEIILSDQTTPPNIASLDLTTFDPSLYSNSVVQFDASGTTTYGNLNDVAREKRIFYTDTSCNSGANEIISLYNKAGLIHSGTILGSDSPNIAQTVKTLRYNDSAVRALRGTFGIVALNGNTIYAIGQNYLFETCSGTNPSNIYDRLFSARPSVANNQDQYSILFTTAPRAPAAAQFTTSSFVNATGLTIKFNSTILTRATSYVISSNGTTTVTNVTEMMLDSSTTYQADIPNLAPGSTQLITVRADTRSTAGSTQTTITTFTAVVDIDECIAGIHDCHGNANCTNTDGSFFCKCLEGFSGNGFFCEDINECTIENHTCDINAKCHNTNGSFTCKCNTGYSGDGMNCYDVNECTSNHTCDTNANCSNTNGSFTCMCNTGYSGNGMTCEDINECMTGDHDCDRNANCTNTNGSFWCVCMEGYSGNGKNCTFMCDCSNNTAYHGNVDSNNSVAVPSDNCETGCHRNNTVCGKLTLCENISNECPKVSSCAKFSGPLPVITLLPTTDGFSVEIAPFHNLAQHVISYAAFHQAMDNGKLITNSASVMVGGKRSNTLYTVSVLRANDCNISNTVMKTVRTAPNGVEVLSFITTPTFIAIFLEQIPGVTAYQVEVTNTNNLTDTRVVAVPDNVTEFHYVSVVTNLLPNTNYSARARASQIAGVDYTSTQSPYGPVKTVVTDMISVFGVVSIPNAAGNTDDLQTELLTSHQNISSSVVSINMISTTNADGYIVCHYELLLSDQSLPPSITGFNLTLANPTRYKDADIGFNGEGNYAVWSYLWNEINVAFTSNCGYNRANETLTLYNSSGEIGSGLIFSSDDLAQSQKTVSINSSFINGEGDFMFSLNENTIYAVGQNYLVHPCIGTYTGHIYDRKYSAQHRATPDKYKYIFLFTTGPPDLPKSLFKVEHVYNGTGFVVSIPSNILKRLAEITFSVNGNKQTLTELQLDSSESYHVTFSNLQPSQNYLVVVNAKVRAGNGTLLSTNDNIFFARTGQPDINECSGNPCSTNEICVNTEGSFECQCTAGFTKASNVCEDVNECVLDSNPCQPFALCRNTPGSYICLGPANESSTVRTIAVETAICTSHNCSTNAQCHVEGTSFTCSCKNGFTGDGYSCTDENECLSNPCGDKRVCQNTDGSYICSCLIGFCGPMCLDINECSANPCPEDQICINTNGSFFCNCSAGYEKVGSSTCSSDCNENGPCGANLMMCNSTCSDIDECQISTKPCDSGETCINTIGSYICQHPRSTTAANESGLLWVAVAILAALVVILTVLWGYRWIQNQKTAKRTVSTGQDGANSTYVGDGGDVHPETYKQQQQHASQYDERTV